MTLPPLNTHSLAYISLLASVVALIVSLARFQTLPPAPVRTALAEAPKTELTHALTNRDPAAARAYYLSRKREDLTTYTHPVYGFSLPYFKDFTVQNIQDDQGQLVLIDTPAVGMGFQIFITPDDETGPLTNERIQRDLPDMVMGEVVEFTLPDDTAAVRFVSRDTLLGDVGEIWFRKDGHLFQLSMSAPDRELQDAWVRDLAAQLTFSYNDPPSASAP